MKVMFNIKKVPYGLLLLTGIALLFVFVFASIANVSFQDKTVFSIPLAAAAWIFPLFLLSFWLLYVLTNRFLYSVVITWIHVLITVFATILIMTVLYLIGIKPSPSTIERPELIGNAIQILSIIFVLGQPIYLANVAAGLLGKHKA